MPIDIKSTVKCLSLINDDMQIREGFHIFTLEKEMAIRSVTVAWKIPWTEKPDRLQSMGLERVEHD